MATWGAQDTTIAIIGGGVSGALTAYHLVEQGIAARVVVIDPRAELGLGLAYSTPSLRHLLNVPAGKISALPEEPDHFVDWLRVHHDPEATAKSFAPRAVFGRYVQCLVAKAERIEHLRAAVVDCRVNCDSRGTRAILVLDDGGELIADAGVLAMGNFDPAPLPGVNEQVTARGAYRYHAWLPETYAGLAADASVTLIGTGLTGVDALLRLRELGHRGTITAVSRHGVFPHPHADYCSLATSAIPVGTEASCVAYLRALRKAIREGAEWRAAIDSVRATTNDLWQALPLREQERFRRHLQRRWDVVRHRMAPAIAAILKGELEAGTLRIQAGQVQSVEAVEAGARVTMRSAGRIESFETVRVINCTGPDMNYRRVNSPLMKSLFEQGLVCSGPLGGGFDSTREGALIGSNGEASDVLSCVGPGRLGTLMESIAIPEIRAQAMELARNLVTRTSRVEVA